MPSVTAQHGGVARPHDLPPPGRGLHRRPLSATAFVLFFALFPLWWVLGVGQLGFIALAGLLGAHLLVRKRLVTPPWFGLWLLFLLVLALSVTTLWATVPGLQQTTGGDRLLTYGFWLAWFLTATVVLLYIGNTSESVLPTSRVVDLMAWMFLITVLGGYAGQFLWWVDFPSLLELLLPAAVAEQGLVHIMIHPGLAQVQEILGYPAPRPKAPWTYANSWGANYGLLLPFFVLAFTGPDASRRRRRLFPILALVALPPVVFTLNRGLWLGLVLVCLYVGVRLALQGRYLLLGAAAAAGAGGLAVIATTPLGGLLQARIANPHSNSGRANLSAKVIETVTEHSPVIGFGTPRELLSNFHSIAGGATTGCPQCLPPQLGTQGSMWFLLFTTGFLGAVLFLSFLAVRYAAALRAPDALSIAMTSTGIFLAVVIWVYDLIGAPLVTVMVALGLLWRAEQRRAADGTPERLLKVPRSAP